MGINVLSLFDGISCGQIALERAGIKVDNYFASEIDKYAIKVTQYNYPDTRCHLERMEHEEVTVPVNRKHRTGRVKLCRNLQ